MELLVIGLGSMGKRRIRIVRELYPECCIVGVDAREDRRSEVKNLFDIESYESIELARKNSSIKNVLVCTSPLTHNGIIRECLINGWNVFTEINLVSDGYVDNIKLAKEKNCYLFLSSTFLYREEVKYINKKIIDKDKWNYIYHIGQYLPDWHPWENYKDFFVGNKRTNGCREILAIELPWLTKVFGGIKDFNIISDNISDLSIEYCDNHMIQISHEKGNKGLILVDIVSPVAVRRFEAYKEHEYIQWSGTPDTLYEYDKNNDSLELVKLTEKEEHIEGYRSFVVENAYKNEIKAFSELVQNGRKPIYGFEDDLKVLEYIDSMGV